jgi:hypothetical protein
VIFVKNVQKILGEANDLFEQAEIAVEETPETGYSLFLQGISLLFKAFLNANGVAGTGDLLGLFYECKQLEPEFEDIEAELLSLLEANPALLEGENLCDSANEIWDFVVDFVNDNDIR